MDTPDTAPLVAQVQARVRYQLLTRMGRTTETASAQEFFLALIYALREVVMLHWSASSRSTAAAAGRTVHYLSMEYLPGRMSRQNGLAFQRHDLLVKVVEGFGRRLEELLAFEPDPGLGNGGLGRLASCILEGAATHRYPVKGYGLRYQYGIFQQQVWGGMQVERPDMWLAHEYPWEFRHDTRAVTVRYGGRPTPIKNMIGEAVDDLTDFQSVRALPYDIPIVGYPTCSEGPFVTTLRLWSTKESPRNFEMQCYNSGQLDQAAENTLLTDVLYPNDSHDIGKRIRLKQEFLLVSASMQDLFNAFFQQDFCISSLPDRIRIQINDTHPALAVAELLRVLTKTYSVPWKAAREMTMEVCGYTNHTLLREALEEWEVARLRALLPRQTAIIERLNQEFCDEVRAQRPDAEQVVPQVSILEQGNARMASLAIVGCHRINGVAPLHSRLLKEQLFPAYQTIFPHRFCNVTNGVSPRKWILEANPLLAQFLTEQLGPSWITSYEGVEALRGLADNVGALEQLRQIKQANKENLAVTLLQKCVRRDQKGRALRPGVSLDPSALFDVHAKRIHEYKRQLLSLMGVLVRLIRARQHPTACRAPKVFLYAGKAAPGYREAKGILQLITALADYTQDHPEVAAHTTVVFLEGWEVSLAQQVVASTDLSEQISCAGYEASGTGNMKFSMNGALTVASRDGANLDMEEQVGPSHWPFVFGVTVEELQQRRSSPDYTPQKVLDEYPQIAEALEWLRSGELARYETDRTTFDAIYQYLVHGYAGKQPDPYYILRDLPDYLRVQDAAEALYLQPIEWHRTALYNMAGMGHFSIDRTVRDYAEQVWGVTPVALQGSLLHEAKEHLALFAPVSL